MMDKTVDYYNTNADAYFAQTAGADFSATHAKFCAYLPTRGRILDAGCGSGRDAAAFARMGYEAEGLDASSAMARLATEKLGVHVTPEWFTDVEEYDPCKYGYKFGDKPVLLFYNTKDNVVYPDTSKRCARAYKNHRIVKVTTDDGHGYEMGYRESELKDMIMDKLADFLAEE